MIKMFRKFKRFINCKIASSACMGQGKNTREVLPIKEITYEELLQKVKEGATLLDVRTKQEFKEGHLDAALLIPYYEISKKIEKLIPNKEQSIVVYCQNGGRSQKAYEILNILGYKNVFNLKNGIKDL